MQKMTKIIYIGGKNILIFQSKLLKSLKTMSQEANCQKERKFRILSLPLRPERVILMIKNQKIDLYYQFDMVNKFFEFKTTIIKIL